ncbi:N-acetyl-anhydromuranmyl-L-alanine amidase [Vibrio sp. 10N.286.49.B3]|uniref:1,6-anhydro-N-acetylmuramyl-L-alanine amidase AmpD n=1 Tax=Vibrio sp. 10N.286.49.B3 TaxID=1880855 RepID=UPI000C845393|nr:1,6-anhydro-N-acetylmuramyl-L-alanine amidase AmpD [Vibrio sp. 10N.286.49.B3]PMH41264.1 N-acetyl-anhydromuranmyl-L-alanine amidase [Vibrio sp. 10N.286.49.B3]
MMNIDKQGWLSDVKKVPSPFYDQRGDIKDISLLVLHNISLPPGEFGGPYIEQLFTGKLNPKEHCFFSVVYKMKVSAHCLIRRDGEIVQFVSFMHRAWHAGLSCFAGRSKCNDYSVGVELEGSDFVPYTKQQYQALQQLTLTLQIHYPAIIKERITGHQYIAPLRKTDPGLCFDWSYYRSLLKGE